MWHFSKSYGSQAYGHYGNVKDDESCARPVLSSTVTRRDSEPGERAERANRLARSLTSQRSLTRSQLAELNVKNARLARRSLARLVEIL